MTHATAQLVLKAECEVGESLIWNPAEKRLYWVDIPAKTIHRLCPIRGTHGVWSAPEMTGCIALSDDGGLIAGMETGLFTISFIQEKAIFKQLCTVPHAAANMRFNDGRCDRQGRFIAGTMTVNQTVGLGNPSVYQYSNGQLSTLLSDFVKPFTTPNGTAFSPGGGTFYLSDSHASQQTVWAFDYDCASGQPSGRREFINMNAHPGRPDGAAMDSDGCYWICATDAGMIHRFTPQGKLDRSLTVPVKKPTICTFGGDDLRTLYVASIRPKGIDLSDQPLAGSIFAFDNTGSQGIAETPFAQSL
jgi:sugar lactone lactonase YvrE